MVSRRTTALCCAAVAAVLFGTSCTRETDGPPPGDVVIGVLAPMTGPDAVSGREAAQGAELAADLVNGPAPDIALPLVGDRGLVALGGARLRITVGDTKGNPDGADDVAAALVTGEHAVAVVAADSAEVVADAAAGNERLRVPTVDASSSATYLTELGRDWYFRLGPSDATLSATAFALIDYVRGARPARPKLTLLEPASGASAAETAVARDLAEQAGYSIGVVKVEPGRGADNLAGQIATEQPDALLAVMGAAAEAKDVTELAEQLPGPPPLLGLGHGFTTMTRAPEGEGVLLRAVSWSAEYAGRNPTAIAVGKRYQERFGHAMSATAASAFTATLTVAMAVAAGGSADPVQIRAQLRRLWVPATQTVMPWDGIRFDSTGQNQLAAGLVEQRAGNAFQVVFPRELARTPVTWQLSESPTP